MKNNYWMAVPFRLPDKDVTEAQCAHLMRTKIDLICKKYEFDPSDLTILIAHPDAVSHPLVQFALSAHKMTLVQDDTFNLKTIGLTIPELASATQAELDKQWALVRLRIAEAQNADSLN